MDTATFTFHGALNYFLPRKQKNKTVTYEFDWKASVKDMIEAIGPPHPEIELVTANGTSVSWDYIVQPNDDIQAYPDFDAINLPDKVRLIPPYQGRPRFILDTHLGRLASYLRMMGFHTLYENDYADDVLAQVSHDEQRIVLTRDVGVLKRGIVVYGYFVRNTDPRLRLHEITERYHLAEYANPFSICTRCNGKIHAVNIADLPATVPQNVRETYDTFHQCEDCGQVYWAGSHHQRITSLIDEVIKANS